MNQPHFRASGPHKGFWSKLLNAKFLFLSLLVHILFIVSATIWVIQTTMVRKKLEFNGGPAQRVDPTRKVMEYKVSLASKNTAPSIDSKRVTTTGISKIALPDLPELPSEMTMPVSSMGTATGNAFGAPPMAPENAGGGAGFTMFGFRTSNAAGLTGKFYDLKQTKNLKPIPGIASTLTAVSSFVKQFTDGGWKESDFGKYYQSSSKMKFTQLLLPTMSDKLGPACFGEEKNCKPQGWVVHYKGFVIAPETMKFHFVGGGDDWLLVRFNNQTVLEGGWVLKADRYGLSMDKVSPTANLGGYYNLAEYEPLPRGYPKSGPIEVRKGEIYPIEILFGEVQPDYMSAVLLIEVQGAFYKKDRNNCPILPLFRTGTGPLPPRPGNGKYPPHADNGPVWTPASGPNESIFHH